MSEAFRTPPPADPGDRVAVVAPSSGGAANARHVLALSLRRLREQFEDPGPEAQREYRADQRSEILSMLDRYNPDATAVFDLDFGHTNPTAPIPIGGRVEIDPASESIRFA